MTAEQKLILIKKILEQNQDLRPRMDVTQIGFSTRFSEDMGFDSLAMMSLIYELQNHFSALSESILGQIDTVEQLIHELK